MYAIRNKRTRKWLYGTDYRFYPPKQRTSFDRAMIFESEEEATVSFRLRSCGKAYEIIPVRIESLVEGEGLPKWKNIK